MDPVLIPADIGQDEEYRLWGKDRQALANCGALNRAKAETIKALEEQGAR